MTVAFCDVLCATEMKDGKKNQRPRAYYIGTEAVTFFSLPDGIVLREENGTVARATAIGFYWKPSVWKGFRSNGMRNE